MAMLTMLTSFAVLSATCEVGVRSLSDQPTQVGRLRSQQLDPAFMTEPCEEPFAGAEEGFPSDPDRFGFNDGFADNEFAGPEEVFPRSRVGFQARNRDVRQDQFRWSRFWTRRFDQDFERGREDLRNDIWTRRFSNEGFRRDPFGLREDLEPRRFDDDRARLSSFDSP